jgi:hypothetical protein
MSPAPRFVTSDNFGAPGVYIQEVQPTPPVRGILNRVVGIAGQCVRGPVNKAVEVTGYGRFVEVFGERDYGAGGAIVGEIWKALLNKPFGKLVIVRAAAAAAVKADFTLETAAGGAGAAVAKLVASSPGVWGNSVLWKVSAADDGVGTHWNLELKLGSRYQKIVNIDTSSVLSDNTALKVGTDDGRLIDIVIQGSGGRPVNSAAGVDGADSSGFTALGQVVTAFSSTAGADGSIADSDFTATAGAMEIIGAYKGVGICMVAGRSTAAVKTKIVTLAAATSDRVWLACPDSSSVTLSTAQTERATLSSGRVAYEFNYPTTLDPTTAALITVEPHSWMAAILSQTEPDVHPGVDDVKTMLAGIRGLTFENLQPGDYDSADASFINALERDDDGNFHWVSGRLTDGSQIDARRTKDFLIAGIVGRLKGSVYRPNTRLRRDNDRSAVLTYLTSLARQERFIAIDEDTGIPQVVVKNGSDVNNENDQARGIQRTVVMARLIPMNLVMSFKVSIGTDVVVDEQHLP